MKKLYVILVSIFLNQNYPHAQNLVNNSNFDKFVTYRDQNGNIVYEPQYWHYDAREKAHPVYYSTDRFLNKSIQNNSHPEGELIQRGEKLNYISFPVLPKPMSVYTELTEPLVKGEKYSLRLDLKMANQANCISDLLISFKNCLTCDSDSAVLNQLILLVPDVMLNNLSERNWCTLETEFLATGNEKVLVIGSGTRDDYLKIINSNRNKYAFSDYEESFRLRYYLDNVYLVHYDIVNALDSIGKGEKIILENIYFKFDEFELLSESFPMLDKVAAYLKNNKIRIQISGFTDNIGSDKYNIELSDKRAKSVVDYLISKGIEEARLSHKGYGASYPVKSNNTEEGRKKNRRIEIKIIEK